jgi:hypothetical protein
LEEGGRVGDFQMQVGRVTVGDFKIQVWRVTVGDFKIQVGRVTRKFTGFQTRMESNHKGGLKLVILSYQ